MVGSFLSMIHPGLWVKQILLAGEGASLCLMLLGLWVGLGSSRSLRSLCGYAWVACLGFLTQVVLVLALAGQSHHYWWIAAFAGTLMLGWILLTPVVARWSAIWLHGIAWLATLWMLLDVTYLGARLVVGQAVADLSLWHLVLLSLALLFLIPSRLFFHTSLYRLSLGYLGALWIVAGYSGMPWGKKILVPISTLADSPLIILTVLTGMIVLGNWVRSRWQDKPDILSWYHLHQGSALTHLFLIFFTILTMYPVLWVMKMAATPQKGFSMGLNPLPPSLIHYVQASRRGEHDVARCYRRAMSQNFRELLGVGEACHDQVCQVYRIYGDTSILRQQESLCRSFAVAWKTPEAQKAQALQRWKTQHLQVWQGSQRNRVEKLLQNIEYQQDKREKDGQMFWRYLLNSVLVSLVTTFLGLLLACTAAYAFSRFRFPGRQTGLMSFLVSQMFPGTLMMIPLYILMSRLGLLDSLVGLSLVYSTTAIPFCVWMLKGYFDTIPREIEEAALIDGASRTLIFWKIMLPLARPAIAVTALFSFMTAWNEFILAATFMNQETSYTLPVMLYKFVGQHDTDWGHFAAGAILVSLPIVFLFFALQRNLVSGLTAGSVKG